MNITFNFKGSYYVKVIIMNSNGNIIYNDYTYNGKVNVCLDVNQIYKVIGISCGEIININIYIDSKHNNYLLYFPRSIKVDHIITFLLTDSYYENLPIERGELKID